MTDINDVDRGNFRQVTLSSLNESVGIISTYAFEDLNFLSDKALSLLKELKREDK